MNWLNKFFNKKKEQAKIGKPLIEQIADDLKNGTFNGVQSRKHEDAVKRQHRVHSQLYSTNIPGESYFPNDIDNNIIESMGIADSLISSDNSNDESFGHGGSFGGGGASSSWDDNNSSDISSSSDSSSYDSGSSDSSSSDW